jgi:hypothetical protein
VHEQEPQATDAAEKGGLENQCPLEVDLRRETQREPQGLGVIIIKAMGPKFLMHNPSLGKNAARKAFVPMVHGNAQAAEQALLRANGKLRVVEGVEARVMPFGCCFAGKLATGVSPLYTTCHK